MIPPYTCTLIHFVKKTETIDAKQANKKQRKAKQDKQKTEKRS